MKEASGELNMTVVVAILIGMLASFFFGILFPKIKGNYRGNTKCDEAICVLSNTNKVVNGVIRCTIKGTNEVIYCTWKG